MVYKAQNHTYGILDLVNALVMIGICAAATQLPSMYQTSTASRIETARIAVQKTAPQPQQPIRNARRPRVVMVEKIAEPKIDRLPEPNQDLFNQWQSD